MRGAAALGAGLALCVAVGLAGPAAAGTGGTGSSPATFVFSAPRNASQIGGVKPAVLGAGPDGTVNAPFAGTNNLQIINSYNLAFDTSFANQTWDNSPDQVGNLRMVSDAQGRIHAAWYHNFGNGTTQIYYARKAPGTGATPWQIHPISGSTTGPATNGAYRVVGIAVGQGDRVYVSWARNGATGVGMRVAFTDDGTNWSPVDVVPGPFSNTATDFNIGATTGGYLFAGWFERESTDILVRMKPPGGAWGPITDVSSRANNGQDYTPRFARAPDGGLRLVWTGVVHANPDESDAFYRQWTPGAGWSATIVQLFQSPGNMNSTGLEITVDSTGVNHIVWDDDSGRAANNVTTYYLRGKPGSFTAPQAVYPQFGQATTRYPYVDTSTVSGGTAKVHVVGNSNVGGGFDNYYTWTDANLVPPSPTPIPASPTPCTPNSYSDVPPGSPFYTFIHDLSTRGAISGYGDCTFRPYNNITRGQIAKVIMLADGYTLINPATPDFADVSYGSAFYTVVETAYHNGIISGYTCGGPGEPCDAQHRPYFRPFANVTRGQLSKMVVLARSWTVTPPATPDFADVGTASPYYGVVETAYEHGIISGYTCGGPGEPCDAQHRPYFRPYGTATRGQAAKIIDLALSSLASAR